jgi:acyl-coenzyme A thioesterase PaaI-like protein
MADRSSTITKKRNSMNITEIPFNKFIEIASDRESPSNLCLAFKDNLKNHLGTFHASAQFALAEACSGLSLQKHFPHLENSVVPVLRKSEVKFKKPALSNILAKSVIDQDHKKKFEQQLERKNRASIQVAVDIVTQDGTVTMSGVYEWYVQKI